MLCQMPLRINAATEQLCATAAQPSGQLSSQPAAVPVAAIRGFQCPLLHRTSTGCNVHQASSAACRFRVSLGALLTFAMAGRGLVVQCIRPPLFLRHSELLVLSVRETQDALAMRLVAAAVFGLALSHHEGSRKPVKTA